MVQGGKWDIDTVADQLAVSKRTLQNRLKEEQTSYLKLLDALKNKMAVRYLETAKGSICEIAFLLGFSEQSAFNHAFKRWTGKTPMEYLKGPKARKPSSSSAR